MWRGLMFLPNAAAHAEKKVDISGDWVCAVFRFRLWSYPVLPLHGTHGCDRHPAFPAPSVLQGVENYEDLSAAHRENASVRVLLPDK
jgi:hypothetical protein